MSTSTRLAIGLPRPNHGRYLTLEGVLYSLLVIAFLGLTLLPLLAVVQGSFENQVAGAQPFTLDGWRALLHEPRILGALGNTLSLTLVSQGIALPLSIGLAWLLGRTDLPGRRGLEFAFWVSFFLPALAVVQGWTLLLDPNNGLLNRWLMQTFGLQQAPLDIYSWWGIVFAHLATTTVSAKVMMLTPAFQSMDARYEEAALMAGDSRFKALCKVTLPLLKPALIVTAIMGVIRALESFEIELVLGAPKRIDVYSTLIYDMTRYDPINFASAFALGMLIIAIMGLLAIASRKSTQNGNHVTVSGQAKPTVMSLGKWRWPLGVLVASLALLLTVIPLVFLATSSFMSRFGFFNLDRVWTLEHWQSVVGDPIFFGSVRNTLVIASGSAVFAAALSLVVAYTIVRSSRAGRAILEFAAWVPFSIPGVLFSLAMLWLILHTGMDWLYGSTLSLVITVGLASVTLGVQLIRSQLLQINRELEEAAWISGASRWKTVLTIVIPLCIRSIVVVSVMAFVSAARDISHLSLLVSSDNRPLSLLQLEYIAEGRNEASAVVGLVIAVIAIVAALVARRLGYRPASHQV
ncbi:iron ABC transporter permease [Pseudomonas sp. 21LCFQ02]|uniref:ABC transporter permease n=1 Tax=Pseudomonas sp. 21LCFQ02 TaxID=2957505 RepID=UPI00209B39E7|nr:iron ABC transporter permease [Pseudomonas sp. 21LCFQ02]MCO8167518.1 iron ABC transporter permease [Pseudomonas sp. 21LCFQ02]